MPLAHLHSRTPLALVACLLLAACASTGGPNAGQAADDDATNVSAYRTATAPSSPAEFKGPQIVFAPSSAELPDSAQPLLDEIAVKLKADPQVNVMLIGHTDGMGSSEMSIAVSGRCARAVSLALIKRGAKPTQIRIQARGNDRSLRNVRVAASRVDIVMLDNDNL